MEYKNENSILKIIKFTPPLFILTLGIIIALFLYFDTNAQFEEQKLELEKNFRLTQKDRIKLQINRVYNFIINKQKTTESKLKKDIKDRVYEAHAIAMSIYNENKHLGEQRVKKMIQDALVNLRFNDGRGYFFIYGFDYNCILLPVARHLEGKSFYDFKEGKGEYLTRNIVKQMKKEHEGYMQWWFHKPSDMEGQYRKVGFNIHFKPYDWFIGTGEYVDDVESIIKKEAVEHISKLRYKNNGYIFILDRDANYVSFPNKELIGKNIFDEAVTVDIERVYNDIVREVNNGGGYTHYIHKKKIDGTKEVQKTSYVKGIDNWDWVIGTGFYDDDLQKAVHARKVMLDENFHSKFKDIMILTLSLTLILLIVSVYISQILDHLFKKYKKEIKLHHDERSKQQNILAQNAKMAAMGEMIGNIAHQWRQPLSAIATAATGLKVQKELDTMTEDDFNRSLDYINTSSQYLSKTIDDFRNFFKKDKTEKVFCIQDVYDRANTLMESQFKTNEIVIVTNIQEVYLLCLKNELVQVFINLLNNARDELIKQDTPRLIFINIYKEKESLKIEIKDNAGGISDEIMDRIFEPYFSTKHQSQGTGIGLYMVEEIITKHMDGKISVTNEVYEYKNKIYKGAQFVIELGNVIKKR